MGVAPGQPPEFSIFALLYKEEEKNPRLLLWVSLSWIMDDRSFGLCVDESRAVLAWLNLTLHQPSLPRFVLRPLYQILRGHKCNSDQRAETICFLAVSFLTEQLVHSAQPTVAQPLELRANARKAPGAHDWDRGERPFQQPPGKVQQKAALEPVCLSLG